MGFFSLISEVKADPIMGFSRLLQVPSKVRNLRGMSIEYMKMLPEMVTEILIADWSLLGRRTVVVHVAVADVVDGESSTMRGVWKCLFAKFG